TRLGYSAPRGESSAPFQELAVSAIRKTTAERMLRSSQTTAAVTLTTTVDATNLVNLRQQFKAVGTVSGAPAIGYTDIVIKLAALALESHPMLNSSLAGEMIRLWRDVHIGVAVDTDAGLLVPVVRDVSRKTLRQVATESRSLFDRARAGKLTAA